MAKKTEIASMLERHREESMEHEGQDLPFHVQYRSSRNIGVWIAVVLVGFAVVLVYLGLSLLSGLASNLTAAYIISGVFLALVVAAFSVAFVVSRKKQGQVVVEKAEYLVKDTMIPDPVVCGVLDSVQECARMMYHNNVGFLIVRDEADQDVGILTDRDIVCGAIAQGFDSATTPVAILMQRDFESVDPESPLIEAILAMKENGVRRIPVTKDGRCIGVVSLDDLILNRTCSLDEIEGIIAAQLSEPGPRQGLRSTDQAA